MRRKRKKIKSLKTVLMMLVFFCTIVAVKKWMIEDGAEVVQVVKESDLSKILRKTGKNQDENEKNIRVLIMGNGYQGETHEKVEISSTGRMYIETEKKQEVVKTGDKITIYPDDSRFVDGNIRITSEKAIECMHLERGYGLPSYEGVLELRSTAEGIVMINELPVEDYLKAVVPSEMPASYGLEALKAQAVCARSYAYRQMENYGYPEYKAHVNDSTDYQVYGNSKPQKSTNRAVKETRGQAVYYQGEVATTYYFSTSCGKTTDVRAWGSKLSEKNEYLKSISVSGGKGDYEKNLPWYRWSAQIPVDIMSNLLSFNTGIDLGIVEDIEIVKRAGGDVVTEVKVTGTKGDTTIKTENKIRTALGGDGYKIALQDGTTVDSKKLLPSAFFTIKRQGDIFVIEGGGFGHGIGMSQNGANEMAKQGKDYVEILELFYQNIDIR